MTIRKIWFWIKKFFPKKETLRQLPPMLEVALFCVEQYEAKKEGFKDVKR
jgi:hypothetical protein